MSEWDQSGGSGTPRPTPGWDTGVASNPAWQERTLRGLAAGQTVFGRYRLERVLGQGGMGVVWLAGDGELGHWVALKFLPEAVMFDPAALEDLRAETRRSLRLTHPNIVRVYHFERETSRPLAAISMELIEGQTLSALRMGRPNRVFEAGELLPWVRQLCAALDYAHGQGMVHRDLKPANLMVDAAGSLKVCDFGIACSLRDSITRATGKLPSGSGTLVYMSPQQMFGESPSPADDFYAIGATLYELLTGKPPFFRGDVAEQVKHKDPEIMAQRRATLGVVGEPIPPEWEAVVAGCLDKDPARRPRTARAVGAALEGRAASDDRRARKTENKRGKGAGAVLAAGLILAAGCAAGWWFGIEVPRLEVERIIKEQRQADEARRTADAAKARLEEQQRQAAEADRQRQATMEAERRRMEQERLAKARGGLLVRTEPVGAMVSIDGGEAKVGPAAFSDLTLGKHVIKAVLPGYDPVFEEAEVLEGQVTEVGPLRLQKQMGALRVQSQPTGSRFEVIGDGSRVVCSGETPATITNLATGWYSVVIRRPGWGAYTQAVTVARAAEASAGCIFRSGSLSVSSDPDGLEFEIDGPTSEKGRTPATLSDIPVGLYEVKVRRRGWADFVKTTSVGPNGTCNVSATFPVGTVTVRSLPPGADVVINGK